MMTPLPGPETGDVDVWTQIANVLARMALTIVLNVERSLPLILPAGVAAYLYGRKFGYRGAALKLFVATGMFMSVVLTPVILREFGMDINTWQTTVCCFVSVYCYKGVQWVETIVRARLNIERRGGRRES